MKVVYRTTFAATCPVDGSDDVYRVRVRSDWMIPVEEIVAALGELRGKPIYQEELTQRLADELGAEVATRGAHSGVATRCTAWAEPIDPERSAHGHT